LNAREAAASADLPAPVQRQKAAEAARHLGALAQTTDLPGALAFYRRAMELIPMTINIE
jgi:hypothetical protein